MTRGGLTARDRESDERLVIGNTAYVVTLGGEVWRIDDVSNPPFGKSR